MICGLVSYGIPYGVHSTPEYRVTTYRVHVDIQEYTVEQVQTIRSLVIDPSTIKHYILWGFFDDLT